MSRGRKAMRIVLLNIMEGIKTITFHSNQQNNAKHKLSLVSLMGTSAVGLSWIDPLMRVSL